MDEVEKFSVEEHEEEKSEKEHHGNHHHGNGHHHGSKHHHSGHHHSLKKRSERAAKKEVDKTKRAVRKEVFFRPIMRIAFFVGILLLVVAIVWTMFSPNEQVKNVSTRSDEVTDKVQAEIQINELQAEIESLKKELEEYKEEISNLEEKLRISNNGVDEGSESINSVNEGSETSE